MHPFTDAEWNTLPIIPVTMDADWDPRVLDHVITDDEAWYDAQPEPTDLPLEGLDIRGNLLPKEQYTAMATYADMQGNLPFHLGPLSDYQPSTTLLPDDTSSTPSVQYSADKDDTSIATDSYSDQLIDDLVYQSYLFAQHAYELDLTVA